MLYIAFSFWRNTIWFILLGALTVAEIIIIFIKADNRKHLASMFIILSGMTFTFEVIVFCFLRAYDYFPMIIPQSPIDDGLAGNLFSQFSVTSTALLIAVLNLKNYWIFIFSAIYGLIEESFLRLGIYSHYWYHTWLTMIGLIILFYFTKGMYKSISLYNKPIPHYILMLFGLFTLHMPTFWWIQILSGILALNTRILPDPMKSYALISILNLFVLSISCMFIYYSNIKWLWKATLFLSLYGILYSVFNSELIRVKDGWFLMFASLDIWGMYLCVLVLDKLFSKDTQYNS